MTDPRPPGGTPPEWKRRPRYSGKNPRAFHEKYKELDPERYAADVQRITDAGKTPAGTHRPVMVPEVLEVLSPRPGELAVDCTLGFGGHATALLGKLLPGGRLIGLDADPLELSRTESRLRAAGFGDDVFSARRSNFAGLPQLLAGDGFGSADVVLADLGVSSMQLDNPDRGFTYREDGPLDMRMNPGRGEPAARLIEHLSADRLAAVLRDNADEPHAVAIAGALKAAGVGTTLALADRVRRAVLTANARTAPEDVEASIRRTFQALRIEVNDEFSALEMLLRSLPHCLAPGGRAAIISFHSGEDRRVKKAFQAGARDQIYREVAADVLRASPEEVRANPRAGPAKLRWAVRARD